MAGLCGFSLLGENAEQVSPMLLMWGRTLRNDSGSGKQPCEDSSTVRGNSKKLSSWAKDGISERRSKLNCNNHHKHMP